MCRVIEADYSSKYFAKTLEDVRTMSKLFVILLYFKEPKNSNVETPLIVIF